MTTRDSHPARQHLALVEPVPVHDAAVGEVPTSAATITPLPVAVPVPLPGGDTPSTADEEDALRPRAARPAASASGPYGASRPASRRREGWFEANPGCLSRAAALVAVALAFAAGCAVGSMAWRLRHSTPDRRAAAPRRVRGKVRRRSPNRNRPVRRGVLAAARPGGSP